uniref:Peptidase aspartic putative domain-containing protein n=1 Tax=Panagrolaimus davidi TaxID=227884 RepID=A0A914P0D4_9BILA
MAPKTSGTIRQGLGRVRALAAKHVDEYKEFMNDHPRPWGEATIVDLTAIKVLLEKDNQNLDQLWEKWEKFIDSIVDDNVSKEEEQLFNEWSDKQEYIDVKDDLERYISKAKSIIINESTPVDRFSVASTQRKSLSEDLRSTAEKNAKIDTDAESDKSSSIFTLNPRRSIAKPKKPVENLNPRRSIAKPKKPVENLMITPIPQLGIPKFDGDYLKWNAFWQIFDIAVHKQNYPKVSKLISLRSFLGGRALEEVESFSICDENYDTVVKTLKDRFGNPQFLVREFDLKMNALRPADPSAKSLRSTVVAVTNLCREMKNFGLDIDSYALKNQIINKLPPKEKSELQLLLFEEPMTSTDRILQKMKKMEIKAELISSNTSVPTSSTPHSIAHHRQPATVSQPWKRDNSFPSCKFCNGRHKSSRCLQYPTPEDKVKQLKIKKCCINCMADDHSTYNCPKKDLKCFKCNSPHFAYLCSKSIAGTPSKAMLSFNKGQRSMLAKEAVVSHPTNGNETTITVFFDSGSQRSYVTKKLIKKLDLPIVNTETLEVTGFGGKVSCYDSDLDHMKLRKDDAWHKIYANSTKEIVDRIPIIERKHNDTFKKVYATPDILIGMDYYCEYINDSRKMNDNIHCFNSKLGEIICGSIPLEENKTISSIVIDEADDAPDECEMFWKLEAMGITDRSLTTGEDEAALKRLEESLKFEGNRYYISWPFKAAHPPLPSNAGILVDDPTHCNRKEHPACFNIDKFQNISNALNLTDIIHNEL